MATQLSKQRLIICEGNEECALVCELITQGLVQDADVMPIGDFGTGGGITGLRRHLEVLQTDGGFKNVISIGIVADSDDDQATMFTKILDSISAANQHTDVKRKYGVPQAPYVAPAVPLPVTVVLTPGVGLTGCLETLYWAPLSRLNAAEAACVDALIACSGIATGAAKWSQAKIDKAKVRAIIALINKSNPALALARLWREKHKPLSVSEPEFTHLIGQLNAF